MFSIADVLPNHRAQCVQRHFPSILFAFPLGSPQSKSGNVTTNPPSLEGSNSTGYSMALYSLIPSFLRIA
jgi:hypothetical protein